MKKVSIVIPTYNRVHIIGETLDSIKAQTFQDWECIIVDDGSEDDTEALIAVYQQNDNRFTFYKRPSDAPKGGNTCRNIGLKKAAGDYVVFFDSDDLMTQDHLEVKVGGIEKNNCDYVITKTEYFNTDSVKMKANYPYNENTITPFNYVSQQINWLTLDVCIKRELAQKIRFNEVLRSGQEYNYFCKLVHFSCNAIFIDQVLSLRRYHQDSIRSNLKKNNQLDEGIFSASLYTYKDLEQLADKKSLKFLLDKCVTLVYSNKAILLPNKIAFLKSVFQTYGIKGCYFLAMLFGLKFFNKGYWFFKKTVN